MLNIYIHYCTKSGFHFTVISQKIRPEIDFEKCNRNFRNPSKSQMLNGNMVKKTPVYHWLRTVCQK